MEHQDTQSDPAASGRRMSVAANLFVIVTALILLSLTVAFAILSRRAISGDTQRLAVVSAVLGSAVMCISGIVLAVMDLWKRRNRPQTAPPQEGSNR